MSDILQELDKVLEQRRKEDPENSYVASLYAAGLGKMIKKVGEECFEMSLAAKIAGDDDSEKSQKALVKEVADILTQTTKGASDRESQRMPTQAAETADNAKAREALVQETADLWFHCMVMLSYLGCDSSQVLEVLQQRFGTSGLAEKASRDKK